jgi:hypothetical protein
VLSPPNSSSGFWRGFTSASFFDKADRDWEVAWRKEITPWDVKGTAAPALVQAFREKDVEVPGHATSSPTSALVPGCGSGAECTFLRSVGFTSVVGSDLSQTAIDVATGLASKSKLTGVEFRCEDFFAKKPVTEAEKFDFIFDYLFFAAIDPEMRPKWAEAMSINLKKEGGILATLMFPLSMPGDNPLVGPPYSVSLDTYTGVLEPIGFKLVKVRREGIESLKPRRGREWMAYWALK